MIENTGESRSSKEGEWLITDESGCALQSASHQRGDGEEGFRFAYGVDIFFVRAVSETGFQENRAGHGSTGGAKAPDKAMPYLRQACLL